MRPLLECTLIHLRVLRTWPSERREEEHFTNQVAWQALFILKTHAILHQRTLLQKHGKEGAYFGPPAVQPAGRQRRTPQETDLSLPLCRVMDEGYARLLRGWLLQVAQGSQSQPHPLLHNKQASQQNALKAYQRLSECGIDAKTIWAGMSRLKTFSVSPSHAR